MPMTLQQWLDKGEAQLRSGPHPERARRDAETLLLHLIGKNAAWLLAHQGRRIRRMHRDSLRRDT